MDRPRVDLIELSEKKYDSTWWMRKISPVYVRMGVSGSQGLCAKPYNTNRSKYKTLRTHRNYKARK